MLINLGKKYRCFTIMQVIVFFFVYSDAHIYEYEQRSDDLSKVLWPSIVFIFISIW